MGVILRHANCLEIFCNVHYSQTELLLNAPSEALSVEQGKCSCLQESRQCHTSLIIDNVAFSHTEIIVKIYKQDCIQYITNKTSILMCQNEKELFR